MTGNYPIPGKQEKTKRIKLARTSIGSPPTILRVMVATHAACRLAAMYPFYTRVAS